MHQFTAVLTAIPSGGHFVVVPHGAAEAAGLRYGARVRGTVNGVAYRSSLMKYAGVFHMGVHKATIAAASAVSGAPVDVTIELDDQPLPTDTVPKDLAKAIAASPKAKAGWAVQSPAHRREHVKYVLDAKKPETRTRRIAATVTTLAKTPPKKPKPPKKPAATSRKASPRSSRAR
jgi:hypothetical protein